MLLPKIKKIPKNTNGRLAIPAPAGLLVFENGEFWCILGGASALYVATAQESEAEEEERERALVKDDILH